ncbi:MAG TPA: BlaI/MecI/CopY family transcriptional regulator [Actinomycetota bacterium]
MAKLIGELGPLEAEIMDHAWKRGDPVTVREVVDSVGVRNGLAYTTVMTVMERLSTKGFLVRRKVGRAYSYKTRVSRDDYSAALVRSVLAASKDRRSVLLGFVRSVKEDDLKELERLVKQAQREGRSGRRS